jgi:hypothetical protein
MVASCAGAALGCYLVSLRVASERASLEDVETKIVLAQRDIRLLQTEIGTRGRLAQLERWNVKVIALSAPTADQFLKGGFELARLTAPEAEAPIDAPVILAASPAPAEPANKPVASPDAAPARSTRALVHHASLKTGPVRKDTVSLEPRRTDPAASAPKPAAAPSKAQKAGEKVSAEAQRPKDEAKAKSPTAKAAVKPASTADKSAKAAKSAVRDPLPPLPRTKVAAAAKPKSSKEPASKQ